MRRVLVMGCSGAGKSTFARRLAHRLAIPVVHLDQLFWREGWKEAPKEEFIAAVRAVVHQEAWVMDGNNPSTLAMRLPRAQTIIWLRRSRTACLWRAARRVAASYGRVRPDMAPGCPERLDLDFLKYIWTFEEKMTPRIKRALVDNAALDRVVTLTSDRETEAFLAGVLVR